MTFQIWTKENLVEFCLAQSLRWQYLMAKNRNPVQSCDCKIIKGFRGLERQHNSFAEGITLMEPLYNHLKKNCYFWLLLVIIDLAWDKEIIFQKIH
jgi:hypothetical protein